MTESALKRQPPTPAEVQERLNRQHGADVPAKDDFGLPAVTTSTGALATVDQASVFQQYADAASPRIEGKLMKYNKGDFVAGENGEEIPEGTRFVALMPTFRLVWNKWLDGRPTESVSGLLIDKYRPPSRAELGDTDKSMWIADDRGEPRDPWQFSNTLVLRNVETDEVYTFTSATRGGISALAELCRSFARDAKKHPDTLPIVELRSDSYMHPNKAYGRIKIPVFTVVGRVDVGGAPQSIADDMNDEIPFKL